MSQRRWFTPSGIVARVLSIMARHAPEGPDIFLAACYGIVEVLGLSRVIVPALNAAAGILQAKIHELKHSNKK